MPNDASTHRVFQLKNPVGLYDPTSNGYSHVAEIEGPARLVFLAGQGGEDTAGTLFPDFRAQMRQAFANVATALDAVGATPRDVVKLTVLVVDHSEQKLAVYGEELANAFGPDTRPATTLIPVPRLALDGMQVEIEATAALPR